VAARRGDASEATLAVLAAQMARDEGTMGWRRLDATPASEETARRWLQDIG
jgi:predicted kinase